MCFSRRWYAGVMPLPCIPTRPPHVHTCTYDHTYTQALLLCSVAAAAFVYLSRLSHAYAESLSEYAKKGGMAESVASDVDEPPKAPSSSTPSPTAHRQAPYVPPPRHRNDDAASVPSAYPQSVGRGQHRAASQMSHVSSHRHWDQSPQSPNVLHRSTLNGRSNGTFMPFSDPSVFDDASSVRDGSAAAGLSLQGMTSYNPHVSRRVGHEPTSPHGLPRGADFHGSINNHASSMRRPMAAFAPIDKGSPVLQTGRRHRISEHGQSFTNHANQQAMLTAHNAGDPDYPNALSI